MVQDLDDQLRAAAFAFVRDLSAKSGGLVDYRPLTLFEFQGQRIPLIQQKGIVKPKGFGAALAILTTFRARPDQRPYQDAEGPDGYLRYKWRGSEAMQPDNVALRATRKLNKPLIWFFGIASGVYLARLPVWLVDEEPDSQQFVLALDEVMRDQWSAELFHPADLALRRQYADATVKRRLHQPAFRARVLRAYGDSCALCRLRHRELLDAAHIKEDSDGGDPVVPNGVAMCAIHHRAFDAHVLGIRPDFIVQVREDVLEEHDGPTLLHALQGVHGERLVLPRQRGAHPDPTLLEERFEKFVMAS
jgi:putative restriction endonuclease